jgi:hypothetical protein
MRNQDVINAFLNKRPAKTRILSTDGNSLYSYNACIAKRDLDGALWITGSKYSVTTYRHTNMLKRTIASR